MDLLHEKVTHKSFGEGKIIAQDDSFITIAFKDETKRFVYPDAFDKFITLQDKDKVEALNQVIIKIEKEQAAIEKERQEEKERQLLEQKRIEKLKNYKIHEISQIVFWLEEDEQKEVFTEWEISSGKIQSGESKGEPNRPARLGPNSAALLTIRDSDEDETERKIHGIYMVNELYTGERDDEGMIPSHEEFRIELTDEEAEKMLFWNYYINKNYPHRTTWNSGKYRYYDNVWTAQILKDIIALKTDEEEIKHVEAFLDYFCKMNVIYKSDIPEPEGALKQE